MLTANNTLTQPIEIRSPLQSLLSFLFIGESAHRPAKVHAATSTTGIPVFKLIEHVGADRSVAEAFISQRFFESFGSRVENFMPRLFSLQTQDGKICGAFGLRSATRKLFLEQYLDTPIEKVVTAHAGRQVERQDIVEVGHFCGTVPGAVRAMICLLTKRLHHEGFEWVTFTGTASLRNAFSRMGLAPLEIRIAEAERLPAEERAAWGRYYDHAPLVVIGNIREGYGALAQSASHPLAKLGLVA